MLATVSMREFALQGTGMAGEAHGSKQQAAGDPAASPLMQRHPSPCICRPSIMPHGRRQGRRQASCRRACRRSVRGPLAASPLLEGRARQPGAAGLQLRAVLGEAAGREAGAGVRDCG
jgi:hypothetical protein